MRDSWDKSTLLRRDLEDLHHEGDGVILFKPFDRVVHLRNVTHERSSNSDLGRILRRWACQTSE
jgi:hypothetical protein